MHNEKKKQNRLAPPWSSLEVGHILGPRSKWVTSMTECSLALAQECNEVQITFLSQSSTCTKPMFSTILLSFAWGSASVCHNKTNSKLSLTRSEVWFLYVLPPPGLNGLSKNCSLVLRPSTSLDRWSLPVCLGTRLRKVPIKFYNSSENIFMVIHWMNIISLKPTSECAVG